MGVPQIVTKSLIASNAALIVASATPVSGTAMTLVSPTTTTLLQPQAGGAGFSKTTINSVILDTPRRVLLTYGNEASNRTMVITGTNFAGYPISETLSVPSGAGGTVATNNDFASVTQVLPLGGGWTAAASVGTNTTGSSPWIFTNQHVTPARVAIGTVLNSGSATWTVEYTYDNPNAVGVIPAVTIPTPFKVGTITNISANGDGVLADAVMAWRLTITVGTGTVTATAYQEGIMQ